MSTAIAEPPATPAAPATPSAAPSTSSSNGGDALQEIDALFADTPPEPKKPDAPAQPAAVKPAEAKPAEKPAEKLPAQKQEPVKKEGDDQLKGAAQLRKAYDDLKAAHAALQKQLEEKSKPVEDEEKKTLKQQYEELNKRYQDTDGELRFVRYEKSQEYRDKYEKPMHKALKDAESEIGELTLADSEGNERKATIQDFAALVDMPLQKAITQAKAWFGDAATEVLAHRRKVVDLSRSAKEAIEDYKKRGSEIEKQTTEQRKKQADEMRQKWTTENQSFATKFKDVYGNKDGDDEGNALLEKGNKLVELAYNENSGLSQEQMMRLHVVVRNKAAAFDRMEYWLKKSTAENEQLKKELQEFKASVPGGGSKAKNPDVKREVTVEEQLMQYANK